MMKMHMRVNVCLTVKGVDCGVVEWVKCCAPRQSGHEKGMNEDDFVMRVYDDRTEGESI